MQFHHLEGYVSGNPRRRPAAGTGIDRPTELPDEMDVLIVGSGPAGMLLAAQMTQFPSITTRMVERRDGRLQIGQADGIQARSVETFQAFGFAEDVMAEAYHITTMNFWNPDPANPENIVRTSRTVDDPQGLSEFPHLIVNQARVLDYFAQSAANGPGRITPDYGWTFVDMTIGNEGEYPVEVKLRRSTADDEQTERTVHAKYVVGCDGAHSAVRRAIGGHMVGDESMHAWAVLDILAVTDFPDIRTKCAIQSEHGSILHIPREGGHLFRMYVDLGNTTEENHREIRKTTEQEAVAQANRILHPYTLEVKHTAWYTVYEVAHRLSNLFDDVGGDNSDELPRAFITGDGCHTHSAKAGQGMNVSMQDGFNLGWKLGAVLEGRAPESLLKSYASERHVVARNLIDFDKEWAALMAKKPEEFDNPEDLADFYTRTWEFPAGFMTEYTPSAITGATTHQALAAGYPIGKRFHSALTIRLGDTNPIEIGHHARADGRWRLYAFADKDHTALNAWGDWLANSPESPVVRFTPKGWQLDAVFDAKVIYQQPYTDLDIATLPQVFLPRTGPFQLIDYEKIYATDPDNDIFELRDIDRAGCVVVVRPDQYVAHVLPLTAQSELADFFAQNMTDQH